MTRWKLEREGLLKGRELKRPDGQPYCTVYLFEENREFLKRYPKNPEYKIDLKFDEESEKITVSVIVDDKKKRKNKKG